MLVFMDGAAETVASSNGEIIAAITGDIGDGSPDAKYFFALMVASATHRIPLRLAAFWTGDAGLDLCAPRKSRINSGSARCESSFGADKGNVSG